MSVYVALIYIYIYLQRDIYICIYSEISIYIYLQRDIYIYISIARYLYIYLWRDIYLNKVFHLEILVSPSLKKKATAGIYFIVLFTIYDKSGLNNVLYLFLYIYLSIQIHVLYLFLYIYQSIQIHVLYLFLYIYLSIQVHVLPVRECDSPPNCHHKEFKSGEKNVKFSIF